MTHADLIERLESLTMWDRETDALLSRHLAAGDAKAHWYDFHGKWTSDDTTPSYTGSIDAAVALVERLLPGAWYLIGKGKMNAAEALYGAQILFGSDEVLGDGESDAAPAIALCIAILRSLEPRP